MHIDFDGEPSEWLFRGGYRVIRPMEIRSRYSED